MAAPAAVPAVASGSWQCLCEHVANADLASTEPARLQGRSSNGAAIWKDSLLVFSGENTPRVPIDDCVHLFDLKQRVWSRVDKKEGQAWPCARIGHTTVVPANTDKLYLYGGRTCFEAETATLSDLWAFDIPGGAWTELKSSGTPPPPLSYQAMATAGKFIYVFGGCCIDHSRSNGLWQFDTTSSVWVELSAPTTAATGPCGRGGPGLAASDEAVFVGFGYNGVEEQSDLWSFSLASKTWTKLQPLGPTAPKNRSVTDLVYLPGSSSGSQAQQQQAPGIFVFGGEFTPSAQGHEGAGEYHGDAFVYDIASNTWKLCESTSPASSTPVARGWFNSMRYGSSVVCFGGFDGMERRNDVYIWTPAAAAAKQE